MEPSVFSSLIFLVFVLTFMMHVFSLQNRKAVQGGDVVLLWSHIESSQVYCRSLQIAQEYSHNRESTIELSDFEVCHPHCVFKL